MIHPDLLLRRVMTLAGELRDHLATGEWELVAELQERFDEEFAALHALVERGHAFQPRHANDLAQLVHVHAENERLARELQASAGLQLCRVSNIRKIGGYAPLGASHRPSSRFIDGSV